MKLGPLRKSKSDAECYILVVVRRRLASFSALGAITHPFICRQQLPEVNPA